MMKKAKKMNINDLGFEEELRPTHILSRLEYDLWGSKNLENINLKRKVHKKA